MKRIFIYAMLTLLFCSVCSAETVLFDKGSKAENWAVNEGGEFPGASCKITSQPGKNMEFHCKYTGKSIYTGLRYSRPLPQETSEIIWNITSAKPFQGAFRVLDADGRTFQTNRFPVKAGNPVDLSLKPKAGPWGDKWGGTKETDSPAEPYKNIELVVNRPENSGAQDCENDIRINAIRVAAPSINTKPFTGENFQFSVFDIEIKGVWQNSAAPLLNLAVKSPANLPAGYRLKLTFPDMYRDKVQRYDLKPGKQNFVWETPIELGGNAYNTYGIGVALEQNGKVAAERKINLKGADSPDWNRKLKTAEVSNNIGSGVHFNYALEPVGDYAEWHDYKKILSVAADSGIKYLRDDFWVYPDSKGQHWNFPAYLERLKYEKSLGFRVIAVLAFAPDKGLPELQKNLRDFVEATKGLIDVYELSNEPHNTGAWIPRYGGNPNGHEGGGKPAPWLLEHLKFSNAIGDCLRELRPDAVIIGGGYVASGNHLALKAGVSKSVNGIVDHPYTNMLPPERITFGSPFIERDGAVTGDANFTMNGFIDAYQDRFKEVKREDLSLWFTEFGNTTFVYDGDREKDLYSYAAYTEETQAAYLLRRFLLCMKKPLVKGVLQYNFKDDKSNKPFDPESNFGLVRADLSPKPAFFAVQNLTTLYNGAVLEDQKRVQVESDLLQRAAKRGLLLDWEENGKFKIMADNGIETALFKTGDKLKLAVWQLASTNAEFSARVVKVRVRGASKSLGRAVGIDMISGKRFDVPAKCDGQDLILTISLGNSPLTIVL